VTTTIGNLPVRLPGDDAAQNILFTLGECLDQVFSGTHLDGFTKAAAKCHRVGVAMRRVLGGGFLNRACSRLRDILRQRGDFR
jgi:hypothetical protein